MTTPSTQNEADPAAHGPRSAVINWVLALCTVPAAVIAIFAYVQVLGSAGCSGPSCPRGPADVTFTLATYGAPILAVLTVVISLATARRARGIVVPLLAWLLLVIIAAALVLTFP